MFWQQRITPTAADPTQQRVMMIMPVMFTRDVGVFAERRGAVLDGQPALGHRPAVPDEPMLVRRRAGRGGRRPSEAAEVARRRQVSWTK